jgi:hypothetical protein
MGYRVAVAAKHRGSSEREHDVSELTTQLCEARAVDGG